MARMFGPGGVLLGLVVMILGVVFQVAGAAAIVYCSVVGAGIILAIAGGVIWVVQAQRHPTLPGAPVA